MTIFVEQFYHMNKEQQENMHMQQHFTMKTEKQNKHAISGISHSNRMATTKIRWNEGEEESVKRIKEMKKKKIWKRNAFLDQLKMLVVSLDEKEWFLFLYAWYWFRSI